MQDNLSYTAVTAADASVEDRAEFIWKVYAHVVGAVLLFAAISAYFYQSGFGEKMLYFVGGRWLIILGAFMLVGWATSHVAHRVESIGAQYGAFGAFVAAQAIIFSPMIYKAVEYRPGALDGAAGVTILGCVGLIATAMITRKDFSFLRGILIWGGMLALVFIVASVLLGYDPGNWFSLAMIGFAGAAVLYDTSNIIHHYPTDKYVAAGMELFASIALMFWYVLRLFMSRD